MQFTCLNLKMVINVCVCVGGGGGANLAAEPPHIMFKSSLSNITLFRSSELKKFLRICPITVVVSSPVYIL